MNVVLHAFSVALVGGSPVRVGLALQASAIPESFHRSHLITICHPLMRAGRQRIRAGVWRLAAVTQACACEWGATLNWPPDGTQGTTTITDNGHPFRVAATAHAAHVDPGPNGAWVSMLE